MWFVKHRHSVVFSDEGRFCLYASDGRIRVRRRLGERILPEYIRARHTGPTSGFMVWGAISYNLQSHLVFLQGKVNSSRYNSQVINPVLLAFFDRKVMCFFSRTVHVHKQLLRRNVHFVVYNNCPWPARSPDLSPIEHVWDMMKRELTLSRQTATTIAEFRRVQDAWNNQLHDDIRHLFKSLLTRIHACIAARLFGHPIL